MKQYSIPTRSFSTKGLQPRLGAILSEETKEKIRVKHKGKKLSSEHRLKVIKTLSYGKSGSKNPLWKGGRSIVNRGYIYLRMKEHPNVLSNGYVAEHRYVMEQKIGRLLTRWEHVHHINGNKHDNNPDNLELVNGQTHNLITMLENRVKVLEEENKTLKDLLLA